MVAGAAALPLAASGAARGRGKPAPHAAPSGTTLRTSHIIPSAALVEAALVFTHTRGTPWLSVWPMSTWAPSRAHISLIVCCDSPISVGRALAGITAK